MGQRIRLHIRVDARVFSHELDTFDSHGFLYLFQFTMTPATQTVVKRESIRRCYIRNTRKFKLVLESSDRDNGIGVEQQIDVKGGFLKYQI